MEIPTIGLPIACKPYTLHLRYQNFIDKEICLLEDAGCISKCLSLWKVPVPTVPKKTRPIHSILQQFYLVLDYNLLNKSINTVHCGNNVISYHCLPNITDLLAML